MAEEASIETASQVPEAPAVRWAILNDGLVCPHQALSGLPGVPETIGPLPLLFLHKAGGLGGVDGREADVFT